MGIDRHLPGLRDFSCISRLTDPEVPTGSATVLNVYAGSGTHVLTQPIDAKSPALRPAIRLPDSLRHNVGNPARAKAKLNARRFISALTETRASNWRLNK